MDELIDALPTLLAVFDWRAHFDVKTLTRAHHYAKAGHVIAITYQPASASAHTGKTDEAEDFGSLLGTVAGTRGRPYECHVSMMVSMRDKRMYLATDCTCPVGTACKHAAALLYVVQQDAMHIAEADSEDAPPSALPRAQKKPPRTKAPPPVDLDQWQRWLAHLDRRDDDTAPDDRSFGLLLRVIDGQVVVLPAWLRPSKNKAQGGTLVDPQALQPDNRHGATPTPPGGWPADVAADLSLLLNAPPRLYTNHQWRALCAIYTEQAFDRLATRYPVWYERTSHPLTRGQPLPVQLQWRHNDAAEQQLAASLPTPDSMLAQAATAWYIDPVQGRYGAIQGDARLLQLLRHAPRLNPRQAAAVQKQLLASDNAHQLPPPVDYGAPIHVKSPPVGVLHMHVQTAHHWRVGRAAIGMARVCFEYAGLSVDAADFNPRLRRLKDDKIYLITRDDAAEQRLLDQLSTRKLKEAAYNLFDYRGMRQLDRNQDNRVVMRGHTALTPEQWKPTLDKLQEAGFRIDYAADFPHDKLLPIDDWYGAIGATDNTWFDVALGVVVGGERIDLLPVLRQLLADPKFPLTPPAHEAKSAQWRVQLDAERSIEVPLAHLRQLIEPLLEWLESDAHGDARVHRIQAADLSALPLAWLGGGNLRAQLENLATARQKPRKPRGLKAVLRPYQRDGLAWLNFLSAAHLGGILADDMGLGKTVQVLAHILAEKQTHHPDAPVLVVAPTSLVGNWQAEAQRFTPGLKVLVIHGADRAKHFAEIPAHDLVITTYPLLPRDIKYLAAARFSLLVLDEAQAIKNAHSHAARAVRDIPAARRLAMTGTPLENHLGELWAQFDAVEPGLLGSERQFNRSYRTPIEKHGDSERQHRLNRRIGALLLRRRKDDVLTDLPPKNEIVRAIDITGAQRELYETLRLAQHARVQEAIKKRGLAQSGIIVLDALLKLRQACCDPRLVKLESAHAIKRSAKLEALLELVAGLIDEGRRILLFSQFTEMLSLIESALDKQHIAYQTLTGQTPAKQRTALVKHFQDGKVPVFLISLKAGGVGLNLTAADTVIHYDPWWNPAVEAQATDRAHRIGQDKPVFVYRLICAGTVEEKIQALQARKAALAQAVLEGGSSQKLRFDQTDLDALFGGM